MFAAFWGEQQAAVALRRGGLYLYALAARRFDCLRRGQVGSLGVQERRPPRRQSDDHHFGSLLVLTATAGRAPSVSSKWKQFFSKRVRCNRRVP
jgi:hypothetical protein